MHPGRPVRRPTEREARREVARDLSVVSCLDGADLCKAGKLANLPLMDVALDGIDGIAFAESKARHGRAP
jgi:hypothetical protein